MSKLLDSAADARLDLPVDVIRSLRYHAGSRGVDPVLLAAELLRESLDTHFGERDTPSAGARPDVTVPAGGPRVLDNKPRLL